MAGDGVAEDGMAERRLVEQRLVERLQAGDEDAFVTLVRAYQVQMISVALAFVGSRAVAEEVVQETWLGVVRGIDRFAGRSSLKTWLFRIVVNRARTAGAREHRSVPVGRAEPPEDPARFSDDGAWAAPLPHWSDEVDDRVVAATMTASIHQAIATLPSAQRQVVTLRDVQGLSSTEVCDLLDLSEANQRVLLHRGRVAVRRTIESQAGED
jgi:RNA polymerase sigma-70 factor, ECF subfamily